MCWRKYKNLQSTEVKVQNKKIDIERQREKEWVSERERKNDKKK